MENASKALLMAGGVLIALAIISGLVLMFTKLQDYQNYQDDSAKREQIAEINNKFDPYANRDITLFELKSLYGMIQSYNAKLDPADQITTQPTIDHMVNKAGETYNKWTSAAVDLNFNNFKDNFKSLVEGQKRTTFHCTKFQYNDEGRVSVIEFDGAKVAVPEGTASDKLVLKPVENF